MATKDTERSEPANGNGNGNGAGGLGSLREWTRAIGIIGIPGAIAIYLVWIGATEIPKIARQQEVQLMKLDATLKRTEDLMLLIQTQIRIAQRSCSNAAKDDNARQRCFDQ